MNKLLPLLLGATAALASPLAGAAIVISQVYGGGGNTGATYINDFIELHNTGTAAVDVSTWSVQYASATGTSWAKTNLTGSIQPGQFYLIQEAAGTGGTTALPTPNVTGTLSLSGTAGKVALVSSQTALTGVTVSNVTTAPIVDFIGFGASADVYEGTGPAAAPSNTTSDLRAGGGCTDTNNNANDFATGAPAPRNGVVACGTTANAPIIPSCAAFTVNVGVGGSGAFTATDADGTVNSASVGALATGVTTGPFSMAAGAGGTATLPIQVAASTPQGSYTVAVTFGNDQGQTANCSATVTVAAAPSLTAIYRIQGSGATSPLVGQTVTTSGVVTKVMNAGFFLQDPVGDGDPSTSDGVFVFTSTAPTVSAGQLVQLTATVTEFNVGAAGNADTAPRPVTELTGPTAITVLGTGSVTPVNLTLPVANRDDLEKVEGMVVTINQTLTVSQNYFLGRYGQLTLSALGRLETPTNAMVPGPGAQALNDSNTRRSILLDDGSTLQNINPIPYIGQDNTVRAGDTVTSVTGVIDFGLATSTNTDYGSYKIQPIVAPTFTRANPRTTSPETVGGNIRVASANVLNFFTTFTNGQTASGQTGQGCALGGNVSASNCRGADDAFEFGRQLAKTVAEIIGLNADAVGLMEMQNNGDVAVQTLVDAVNAQLGSVTYAVVPAPSQGTGTDAIRVAMIYKPSRLTLAGPSNSDPAPINNRPPFAQTFNAPGGNAFTLIVNHLKSKSSCPSGTTGTDIDTGDLQGCWNGTRVQQAMQLVQFIAAIHPGQASPKVVMVGDFNAYAKEDPVTYLTGQGYIDQIGRYKTFGYSYVFNGAAGRLDQAITTPALSSYVVGAAHWPINSDEPQIIDYNEEFKQPNCATCAPDLYTPTPYRSSDHDPVVIGLQFGSTPVVPPVRPPIRKP